MFKLYKSIPSRAIASAVILAACLVAAAAAAAPSRADLVASGRADEAIRALTAQNDAEAYHLLCRVYYSLEDWDKAIRSGEKAVQLNPNAAAYHLWLGRSYGEKADSSGPLSAFGWARKTVAEFERAVQLDPKDWRARHDLAEYYATAPGIVGGGKDKARRLADDIQSSDPVTAALIRALVASRSDRPGEAEQHLNNAVQASGNSAGTLLRLARLYRNQKRWNEFDAAVSRALASSKRTPEDLFNAGELLVGVNRDLPTAAQALKQYLAGPMDDNGPAFQAHYLLGQVHERQGDRRAAQDEYKAALSLAGGFRPAQEALRKLGG